jgi:DNA-binding MarR family transcriptional regulator
MVMYDMSSDDAFDPLTQPRIAALLRMAHEATQDLLYQHVADAGYGDLRPAHFRLLRFPGIDGTRPTDLAQRLETSKQAVNPLLNDLEAWGYVERLPDPDDGRGRVVALTSRGHELMWSIRRRHAEIERDLAAQLGPEAFATLQDALRVITEQHRVSPKGKHEAVPGTTGVKL